MSSAKLNDHVVTSARVSIPAWGCWYADAVLDGEHTLAGAVALKIADLTLSGTVLSGGASHGRSSYRIVGGRGGWGRTIPRKAYSDDAGVKLSKVLTDAAREVGEELGELPATRLGPHWARPDAPASDVLQLAAGRAWYVDETGVTRLGARASSAVPPNITRVKPVDLARGTVTLASETIAQILPGVTVDGMTAVDVEHSVSAGAGLRTTIWGARGASTDTRALAAFRAILDTIDPDRAFRGVWEYRIVTQEGERLNLQPVRTSTGMPELRRVIVRPGVPGAKATHMLGSRVLISFVDSDPSRPQCVGFEDADGEGFTPTLLEIDAVTFVKLADGARLLPATGDLAGGIWPIVGTTRIMG